MVFFRKIIVVITMLGVGVILGLLAYRGAAADTTSKYPAKGVYIELDKAFYQALKSETNKTYTTDKSDEYLRQIAVSTRYMVESNLQILKQQERIITLLEKMQAPAGNKP